MLDFLLMAIAPTAFFVAFAASLPDTGNPDAPLSAASTVLVWGLVVSLSVVVLYPVWYVGRRAQTPGMRRMHIRLYLVNREGNLDAPGWSAAWIRAVTASACWLFFGAWILDYLWPLNSPRRQCLHDKAGRTVAVDEQDG